MPMYTLLNPAPAGSSALLTAQYEDMEKKKLARIRKQLAKQRADLASAIPKKKKVKKVAKKSKSKKPTKRAKSTKRTTKPTTKRGRGKRAKYTTIVVPALIGKKKRTRKFIGLRVKKNASDIAGNAVEYLKYAGFALAGIAIPNLMNGFVAKMMKKDESQTALYTSIGALVLMIMFGKKLRLPTAVTSGVATGLALTLIAKFWPKGLNYVVPGAVQQSIGFENTALPYVPGSETVAENVEQVANAAELLAPTGEMAAYTTRRNLALYADESAGTPGTAVNPFGSAY